MEMEMERKMDYSGSGDSSEVDEMEIERECEEFLEFVRKRHMDRYGSDDDVESEENQSPGDERKFQLILANMVEADDDDESDSDDEIGGWYDLYEPDPSCKEEPRQELKDYSQQAIATYNKRKNQLYSVVDIIRSEKYAVQGCLVCMTFTAKLPNQDDAEAIKFKTEIWVNYVEDSTTVESVGPLTEEETTSPRGRDSYRAGGTEPDKRLKESVDPLPAVGQLLLD